jgi:hypothetical protein
MINDSYERMKQRPDPVCDPYKSSGKVSVLQEQLSDALSSLKAAIDKKHNLPVLQNVLLTANMDDSCLYITATDLGVGQTVRIGAKIDRPLSATVHFATLKELIDLSSPELVHLEWFDEIATLRLLCGSSRSHFKGIKATEFPPVPNVRLPECEILQFVNRADVRKQVESVASFASKEDRRPALTCLRFDIDSNSFTINASDGLTLNSTTIDAESRYSGLTRFIPAKPFIAALKALDNDKTVTLIQEEKHVILTDGKHTVFIFWDSDLKWELPEVETVASGVLYNPGLVASMIAKGGTLVLDNALNDCETRVTAIKAEDNSESESSLRWFDFTPRFFDASAQTRFLFSKDVGADIARTLKKLKPTKAQLKKNDYADVVISIVRVNRVYALAINGAVFMPMSPPALRGNRDHYHESIEALGNRLRDLVTDSASAFGSPRYRLNNGVIEIYQNRRSLVRLHKMPGRLAVAEELIVNRGGKLQGYFTDVYALSAYDNNTLESLLLNLDRLSGIVLDRPYLCLMRPIKRAEESASV